VQHQLLRFDGENAETMGCAAKSPRDAMMMEPEMQSAGRLGPAL